VTSPTLGMGLDGACCYIVEKRGIVSVFFGTDSDSEEVFSEIAVFFLGYW